MFPAFSRRDSLTNRRSDQALRHDQHNEKHYTPRGSFFGDIVKAEEQSEASSETHVTFESSAVPSTVPADIPLSYSPQKRRVTIDTTSHEPHSPPHTSHSSQDGILGGRDRCQSPVSTIFETGAFTAEPGQATAPPSQVITTTVPTQRPRYDREVAIQKSLREIVFDPLDTFAVHEIPDILPWRFHIHPEGLQYFYLESDDGRLHFLTEANLYIPVVRNAVSAFMDDMEQMVERRIRAASGNFPTNVDVVLEIDVNPKGEVQSRSYYMADLDRRCLFWLHKFDASYMATMIDGVECKEHLRDWFDHEFWLHIEHFPSHRQIYPGLLEELMANVTHGCIDTMTSLDSTVPYSKQEMHDFAGLVKYLISLNKSGQPGTNAYVVAASARLRMIIAHERFFHFYGHNGARITRDQSVRGANTGKRSWLVKILSPIFFNAPYLHLRGLERIWVDDVIRQHPWDIFVSKLESDWEQLILYATVLVTANVSFLAIPTVITNQDLIWGSPAVVLSQISIITSMGSIIIGLLLVRQHRTRTRESAQEASEFLTRRKHPQLGVETLAIMYSLPYALLLWGMGTFLTSIAIACFLAVPGNVNGTIPRIVYGIVWAFVCLLILWAVVTGWESSARINWRWLIPRLWGKTKENLEKEEELEDNMSAMSTSTSKAWKKRMKRRFTWYKSSTLMDGDPEQGGRGRR